MPSLKDRTNGFRTHPLKGSKGNILIKTQNELYGVYSELRSDDKSIMDAIMYVMSTNSNHLIVAGETAKVISDHCGYTFESIKRSIVRLTYKDLLISAILPYEYVVNPTFAIKGSECEIWKFLQVMEYKGEIPREVHLDCKDSILSTNF